jgi:hypothetical protein
MKVLAASTAEKKGASDRTQSTAILLGSGQDD